MENGRPQAREGNLIFLHIPKAGGTTLYPILDKQYDAKQVYYINVDPSAIEAFKRLPLERRAQIRLLRGHMPFGLHEYLRGSSVYVTVLRDPVERVISHYFYVLRKKNHRLHDRVIRQKMSLEDYLLSKITTELDNGQTRMLAGVGDSLGFGECTRATLEQAEENIRDHFATVGILERFDETLIVMKNVLKWDSFPFYVSKNVTKKRPPFEHVSNRVIDIIKEYNQLDRELYEQARRSFGQTIAEQERVRNDLETFSRLNGAYQLIARPYWQLRSSVKKVAHRIESLVAPARSA